MRERGAFIELRGWSQGCSVRCISYHFSPFVEDDETFEDYLDSMREDGTWYDPFFRQFSKMHTKKALIQHANQFIALV